MTTSAPSPAIASRRGGAQGPGTGSPAGSPPPAPPRAPPPALLVRHRPAVIARAGGDERVDARLLAQSALDRPRGAEHLERRPPEPVGLVLYPDAPHAELAGERRHLVRRCRRVAVESGVKARGVGARRGHGAAVEPPVDQAPHAQN